VLDKHNMKKSESKNAPDEEWREGRGAEFNILSVDEVLHRFRGSLLFGGGARCKVVANFLSPEDNTFVSSIVLIVFYVLI
jgi:hypothetical protein